MAGMAWMQDAGLVRERLTAILADHFDGESIWLSYSAYQQTRRLARMAGWLIGKSSEAVMAEAVADVQSGGEVA